MEKHGEVWIEVKKQCSRKTAVHDNLVEGNEDHGRGSTKALAPFHTIMAKVLYVSKWPILDTNLGVEFLTMRVKTTDTNEWGKEGHLMEYLKISQDQSLVPGGKMMGG